MVLSTIQLAGDNFKLSTFQPGYTEYMPKPQDQPATKADIARLDKKIDQAADRIITKVTNRIDVMIENRADDVLGVKKDEVSLIKDKQNDHEERIVVVEQKIGLRG